MAPPLREPLLQSNWVLILGLALITVSAIWVIGLLVAYRRSRVRPDFEVRSLSQVHRARYLHLIEDLSLRYQRGEMNSREAHIALGAIIRAAATERTGLNFEAATASEAEEMVPSWSVLVTALKWCEDGSFPTDIERNRVQRGIVLARSVVLS